MTQAISGVGAVIRYWNETSGAWVSIGEVTNISGPTVSVDTHDVTSLANTDGYREYIVGLIEPGEMSFTMWYNRSDYAAMKTMLESREVQNFEMVLPDTDKTSLEFSGFLTNLPLTVPEGPVSADITIKITGSIDINSGSGSG